MTQQQPCARTFALHAHRGQMFNEKLYGHHLQQVVSVLEEFGYTGKWTEAGWLYAVLAKTAVTQQELRRTFGDWVFHMAETFAPLHHSRVRMNNATYFAINQFPDAAIIATADRIVQARYVKQHSVLSDRALSRALSRDYGEFYCHVGHRVRFSMQRELREAYDLSPINGRCQ